jgi:hypothetical protein
LDCLKPHQSQYLWKQISWLGWKTHEPAETDFAPDVPTLFPKVLNLHSEELGYGMTEFSELLRMEPNDLRYLYGLQDTSQKALHLHLIK